MVTIKLSPYEKSEKEELQKLFYDAFSVSEGKAEGALISELVGDLIDTTEEQELFGYIAKEEHKIIGSIFFTRMKFGTAVEAYLLAPVAVHSHYQGRGFGQQLINYGLKELQEKACDLILTYGDPNYYSKTGFQQVSQEVIKAPHELSLPFGWQCQSLLGNEIAPVAGIPKCVDALNKLEYW